MAWFLGQSIVVIVVAFLLGLLVGWLWWGRRRPAADESPPELVRAIPRPAAPAAEVEPPPAPTPEEPAPDDDLQRIEGIGPRMAAALRQADIRTYRQLAEADEATLRAAIEAAGLSFAPSLVTWAQQAQLLADGDEESFADLTRRLVAGRDVGRQ